MNFTPLHVLVDVVSKRKRQQEEQQQNENNSFVIQSLNMYSHEIVQNIFLFFYISLLFKLTNMMHSLSLSHPKKATFSIYLFLRLNILYTRTIIIIIIIKMNVLFFYKKNTFEVFLLNRFVGKNGHRLETFQCKSNHNESLFCTIPVEELQFVEQNFYTVICLY